MGRKTIRSPVLRFVYRYLWIWSYRLYSFLEDRRPGGGF